MLVVCEFSMECAHHLKMVPAGHKCGRQHGHTYRISVVAKGEPGLSSGMVVDYAKIKEAMDPILEKADHRDLNRVFESGGRPWSQKETTCEMVCLWFLHQLPHFVTMVSIQEGNCGAAEATRDDLALFESKLAHPME